MYKLRIRELRENQDLYQRHLAEYLKVSQQTYSRYETGELEPSLEKIVLLADYYDTSVDYILGLTTLLKRHWKIDKNTKKSKPRKNQEKA